MKPHITSPVHYANTMSKVLGCTPILLLFLFFILFSCGTRKTQKTESKEETKKEVSGSSNRGEQKQKETQAQATTNVQTESQNNLVDESENLEPIDATKPIVKTESEKDGVKTTTWENAKVNAQKKTDTSKKVKTSNKTEISNTSEFSVFSEFSEFDIKELAKKAESGKVTESEKGFYLSWWWLLLLIIPIGLWRLYKTK